MASQNVGYFGYDVWENGIVNYTDMSGSGDKVDDVLMSFGKGGNFGIGIGYMFTKNLGAELGANYLLGSTTKSAQKESDGSYVINQAVSAKQIQLSPMVVLKGNYAKINPYAKLGVLLGVGSKVTYEEDQLWNNNVYSIKEELDGGTAVGVTGAIGMDYAVNNKISLFGEIKANSLTYKPEKGSVVSATYNGEDDLGDWSNFYKETEFSDEYTEPTTFNPSAPRVMSRLTLPFSSIGVNLGMRFHF